MATAYQFTPEQIAQIASLRNTLSQPENAALPSGGVALYSYIFTCVTGLPLGDLSLGELPTC